MSFLLRPEWLLSCWMISICTNLPVLMAATEHPNIIVILSDDMGYSDISPYGGEIETPNLNRLAHAGLRFSQFYNGARCCPTRASLLTGLYPHQTGIGWMMEDSGEPGYRGDLNQNCQTIAEVLKPAGYATYAVGKWHVTPHLSDQGQQHNWPLQRGFDHFYGTIHGAGSFYDPNTLTRDNTLISAFADPEYQPETYYYTDAISDHAVRYLETHFTQHRNEPLFMYVAYTAAHWPMHALPEDIAKYRGKYDAGYDAIRTARYDRMQASGLLQPAWQLSPQAENWADVKDDVWEIRCMEVYAAMIDRMDQGIGRVVSALERQQQLENTLIFYLQDNGGCAEGMGRNPKQVRTRADHPTLTPLPPEALQSAMIPSQTRDGFPVLQGPGVLPGPADTYIGYGRGWANVSNTPFREFKHWVHEGGIATPLIAHWPNGITRPGELEAQPGHLVDIMATCIDVAAAQYPSQLGDHKITPLAGQSLRPLFSGVNFPSRAIFFEHEGNRAVRDGQWKLVAKENQPWELYDMEADRTELHNLATQHPQKVQDLTTRWDQWAEASQVLPLGAWKKTPQKRNGK